MVKKKIQIIMSQPADFDVSTCWLMREKDWDVIHSTASVFAFNNWVNITLNYEFSDTVCMSQTGSEPKYKDVSIVQSQQ